MAISKTAKRAGIAVTMTAVGALALAGCSGSSGGGDEIQSGTAISIAQNSAFNTMNPNTNTGNSTYNQNIAYLDSASFNYYDSTPKLIKNTKFGTYKVLSQSPLTIKYTINKGITWSDGTPVNASDLLLQWASSISKYNSTSGVNFNSVNAGTGLDNITKVPKISDGGRSLTLIYDKPYVDWEVSFEPTMSAAATWELAFPGGDKGVKAQNDVIKAIQDDDTATLKSLGTAWGNDYNLTGMPTGAKAAAIVTDGPYEITKLVANQYVTLTARKDYTWGPLPHAKTITVRFIADQTAQVQALENGEINILYGQATSDTVKALKQAKGVTTTTDPTSDYEHIDLTLNNKGPFDPATYGGDAQKALEVRQAFFYTIPRAQIIDRLIKPLSSNIKPDNSATFIPGQDGYTESVAKNGSSAYANVDIDKAKQLLTQAGVTTPVNVKFFYPNDNPRREGEFQLLQASAKLAGFNVEDAGVPTSQFFGANGIGANNSANYDATVFAWSYPSLARTGGEAQFITGGNSNFNGYSNPDVDKWYKQLETEQSTSQQVTLLQEIDKASWSDAQSFILFQLPDVSAWSNSIKNVSDAPLVPNVFWNFWEWQK